MNPMQPKLDGIVYLSEASPSALSELVTKYIKDSDEEGRWELAGELKIGNGEYIQPMVRIIFPKAPEDKEA